MSDLYQRIEALCEKRGINITQLCAASGASRSSLTDLKSGRKQSLSAATLAKIGDYFAVSVDFLLHGEKNAPLSERSFTDEDLKFALWGTDDIDDDDLADVRRYAQFVKERKQAKP